MSATREGGCACGAVRYRLTSDPLFVHCCHCLNCQRQTGSAFVINLLIEADRLEVLAGEPEPVDVPRGSSQKQRIFRCPDLPGRRLQPLHAGDRPLRPRRHARRSVERRAGRPYLHTVEAAMDCAARVDSSVPHVLRHREALAGSEPRAARRAAPVHHAPESAPAAVCDDSRIVLPSGSSIMAKRVSAATSYGAQCPGYP